MSFKWQWLLDQAICWSKESTNKSLLHTSRTRAFVLRLDATPCISHEGQALESSQSRIYTHIKFFQVAKRLLAGGHDKALSKLMAIQNPGCFGTEGLIPSAHHRRCNGLSMLPISMPGSPWSETQYQLPGFRQSNEGSIRSSDLCKARAGQFGTLQVELMTGCLGRHEDNA